MNINLARKWRSKHFEEIVGQPLAVRLVKNSLYRNLLFPVYLLSGTRGTGKTSTARLFAAALNCKQLPVFQKDPTVSLPCLLCESCQAMQQMNHPDFIEIDAASHTGVDNVRQIIDAASFVPVMGAKKIYLIDEAHMLSKAAFNAFLKILEEPPQTVIFMLATTDPHKIIPTVTSRCFQIYFDPIQPASVVSHLQYICQQESLEADADALLLIAQETEGSMRDALNLLERLRALPEIIEKNDSTPVITKQIVLSLLGSIDDDRVCELLSMIVTQDVGTVLLTWKRLEFERFAPTMVWKKLIETIRRALWLKQSINPDDLPVYDHLKKFVEAAPYERLIGLLELCYTYELSFSKTAVPGTLLEMLIVKMVNQVSLRAETPSASKKTPLSNKGTQNQHAVSPVHDVSSLPKEVTVQGAPQNTSDEKVPEPQNQQISKIRQDEPIQEINTEPIDGLSEKKEAGADKSCQWTQCLVELKKLQDPLVVSIFSQSLGYVYMSEQLLLEVTFSKDLQFFGEWLTNTQKIWQPHVDAFFGSGTQLVPQFTGPSAKRRPAQALQNAANTAAVKPVPTTPQKVQQRAPQKSNQEPVGKHVSQSDLNHLSLGSLIISEFPGKLTVHDLPSGEGV